MKRGKKVELESSPWEVLQIKPFMLKLPTYVQKVFRGELSLLGTVWAHQDEYEQTLYKKGSLRDIVSLPFQLQI